MEASTAVALIGLPNLAESLRENGISVITGNGGVRDDISHIVGAMNAGQTPILVTTNVPAPGLRAWLTARSAKGARIVLIEQDGGDMALADQGDCTTLATPFLLSHFLNHLGGIPASPNFVDLVMNPTGELTAGNMGTAVEPEIIGGLEDFIDESWDEPAVSVATTPTATQPTQQPIAPPVQNFPASEFAPEIVPPTPLAPTPPVSQPPVELAPFPGGASPFQEPTAPARGPQGGYWPSASDFSSQNSPAPAPMSQSGTLPHVQQVDTWRDNQTQPVSDVTSPPNHPTSAQPVEPWEPTSLGHGQSPQAPAMSQHVDSLFESTGIPSMAVPHRRKLGQVIISWAAKGGLGKSLFTLATAETLADAGYSVCVIDANRGQADQVKYLRISPKSQAPTIYDFAIGAASDFEEVVLTPDRIDHLRAEAAASSDRVGYNVILGPYPSQADSAVVSTSVYLAAVDWARKNHDFVVIDTQIVEASDNSSLIDGMVIPLLVQGGYAVALCEPSRPGIENLHERLQAFIGAGVDPAHIFVIASQVEPEVRLTRETLTQIFQGYGNTLGFVLRDPSLQQSHNMALKLTTFPEIQAILHEFALAITGDEQFMPGLEVKKGLISRLLRR